LPLQETPEGQLIIKSQKGQIPFLPEVGGWLPVFSSKTSSDKPPMTIYYYYYSKEDKPNIISVRLDVTIKEYPLHGVNTWPICTGWSLERTKDVFLYGLQVQARIFALYDILSGKHYVVLCWIKQLSDAPRYLRINLYTDTGRLMRYNFINSTTDFDQAFSLLWNLAQSIEQNWQKLAQPSFVTRLFIENWPIWIVIFAISSWLISYRGWFITNLREERRLKRLRKLTDEEKRIYEEIKNENEISIRNLSERSRSERFQEILRTLVENDLVRVEVMVKQDLISGVLRAKSIKDDNK
jgi:hypothetical protein